jgi:t-SNARE complex subunit (syntaxin)
MPALEPEKYLSSADLLRIQELEAEVSNLHGQRNPLAAKLAANANSYAQADFSEMTRLNLEIKKLEKEKRELLDKNPLLPTNLPGFRG